MIDSRMTTGLLESQFEKEGREGHHGQLNPRSDIAESCRDQGSIEGQLLLALLRCLGKGYMKKQEEPSANDPSETTDF